MPFRAPRGGRPIPRRGGTHAPTPAGSGALAGGASRRAFAGAQTFGEPQRQPSQPPPQPRRSRAAVLVVGAIVLLLAVIATGLFLLLRGGESPRQEVAAPPAEPAAASPSPSPSPTGVPGIDEPVSVEGLDVMLTSAELSDSYTSAGFGETYHPNEPEDTLLIVAATADGTVEDVQDWKVSVTDNRGRRETPGVTASTTEDESAEMEWVFVVRENAGSFVLNLPGGVDLELDPLLSG